MTGTRLAGEVAIVTGSTSGLGRVLAQALAAEGARVVVTGRDERRGRETLAAVTSEGGVAAFVPADLTDDAARRALVNSAVATFGSLTVLVNNAVAGGASDGPLADLDPGAWDAVFRVDIDAAAGLCHHAIPMMLQAGHGSIVNISSRAAGRGTPGLAAYTAAKGALEALARSITADYARRGIRCNTVRPGYILHERRDADLPPARRARIDGMHLTRVPTAADVAHAVVYLASAEAEVVSGVTLPVDGGSSAVRGLTLG